MSRRGTGFSRLGSIPAERLGLPAKRSRQLAEAAAWARAAGAALAARCRVSVVRGILEVEVEDARWREVVRLHLPTLAARFARLAPTARVRKARLRRAGSDVAALEVAPASADDVGLGPPEEVPAPGRPAEAADEGVSERLLRIRDVYLARRDRGSRR